MPTTPRQLENAMAETFLLRAKLRE